MDVCMKRKWWCREKQSVQGCGGYKSGIFAKERFRQMEERWLG